MGSKFKGDEVKLCEADGLGFEFAPKIPNVRSLSQEANY